MCFRGIGFVVHEVLREIFGGEMEKLPGGWRVLSCSLGEWDLWCMWC